MRRRRKKRSVEEKAANDRFTKLVMAKGECIWRQVDPEHKCRPCDPHHVIPAQWLKDRFSLDLDAAEDMTEFWGIVYDPDNGVPICRQIHANVTEKSKRIPFDCLPPEPVLFAERYGITYKLEAECPRDPLF